jgi:hypothetical protein
MRKHIAVGTAATVRLHDGREVAAKITKIVDSVAGRKVSYRVWCVRFDSRSDAGCKDAR